MMRMDGVPLNTIPEHEMHGALQQMAEAMLGKLEPWQVRAMERSMAEYDKAIEDKVGGDQVHSSTWRGGSPASRGWSVGVGSQPPPPNDPSSWHGCPSSYWLAVVGQGTTAERTHVWDTGENDCWATGIWRQSFDCQRERGQQR